MNIREKLRKQASLCHKLDRSLELQACLDKKIWKGGAVKCRLYGNITYGDILKGWSVKLFNDDVILPKTSLEKLKADNKRLFLWVLETSVMQKVMSNLRKTEIERIKA